MRFKLPPGGDCPPIAAARRLWMTLEEFKAKLPELQERGFPPPDPTTGNFDLDAIDAWRQLRNKQLFPSAGLTLPQPARHANDVVRERLRGKRLDG
jgi:hypothetical protein